MKRKFNEWWSIQRAKNPGRMVLMVILFFNIVFFIFSAAVISALSLDGTESMGFVGAAFCTLTMILDAGCIQFVIADIGQAGVFISVFCLTVVLIGMISFTGSVIGYVTNYISNFIENANEGKHKIFISDHVVILNWNSRASEIINDYLYSDGEHKIVVLVSSRKNEIQREIEERIADTIARENRKLERACADLPFFARARALRKGWFHRNVTVLVREGDVFSTKQLQDISLDRARSIIILGNDVNNTICKFEHQERIDSFGRGNSQTVKTLMQVADITGAAESRDNQKIIVEITDDWTWKLVNRIIQSKQVKGESDIIPVRVNQILGQILSQFSLMPELNTTYAELFSNKGAEFYSVRQDITNLYKYMHRFLYNHRCAIPLTMMKYKGDTYCYYTAGCERDLKEISPYGIETQMQVKINRNYRMEPKNVIILGHNSKCRDIMQGFQSFCNEWHNGDEEIVNIVVIDDKRNLDKMNHYQEYPFVTRTVDADVYDEKLICAAIEEVVSGSQWDTSILILSDDMVLNEDIDANALANLIYVRGIIEKMEQSHACDKKIDVIVEIINPKHHDIVNTYSVNNVVISNRYISKMIAQIGEVDALFDFYADILSYDDEDTDSKEIYIKKAGQYFEEMPGKCTAEQLIRGIFEATANPELPLEEQNMTSLLGYFERSGKMHIFSGDQSQIELDLDPEDKLILFADH